MWTPSGKEAVQARWLRVQGQMDLRPCDGCDLCGIRCAEGVQMTRHEYEAVRRFAGEQADPRRLGDVLVQDKQVDLGDGVKVRMCRYKDMEGGGCVVYEARPLVCRLLGHVEWMPCPVEKVEQAARTEDALDLMRAYSGEERLTFEEWDRIVSGE